MAVLKAFHTVIACTSIVQAASSLSPWSTSSFLPLQTGSLTISNGTFLNANEKALIANRTLGQGNLTGGMVPHEDAVSVHCDSESTNIANQAINDAIAAVQKIQSEWKKPEHRAVLEKYMGKNCFDKNSLDAMDQMLKAITDVKWNLLWGLPIVGIAAAPFVTTVNIYCGGNAPWFLDGFKPTCQSDTWGWSHVSSVLGIHYYYIGFCTGHFANDYSTLGQMVQKAQFGKVDKMNEEALGLNYARPAIHQLVELAGFINKKAVYTYAEWQGSLMVAEMAGRVGCQGGQRGFFRGTVNSLTNADSIAHFVNALYMKIFLNMGNDFPQPGESPDKPPLTITSSDCDGSSNCKYVTMWQSDCLKAIDKLDDNTVYKQYTSRSYKSRGPLNGCIVKYECSDDIYLDGMTGAQIKTEAHAIFDQAKCSKCGHVFLSNGCDVATDACYNCHDTN